VVKNVSTEQKVSRWGVYLDVLKGVIFNSFSVILVLIICKLFASAIYTYQGKESSFDAALKVLLHYGEGAISILFFTSSSFILLFITLIFEPAYFAIWFRKYISIPALNIAGHMLSMSAGAIVGIYILNGWATKYSLEHFWQVLFIWSCCVGFSSISQSAKQFFEVEFENIKKENHIFIKASIFLFGSISTWLFSVIYVSQYAAPVAH